MRITVLIILGIIISFYITGYIEDYIIPDPCAFHTTSPPVCISTFYTFSAGNGGHPFPNLLNLSLTLIFGTLIGIAINKGIKSRK